MKKKVIIGLSVLALVALMAVGTWAWFTAADSVDNTFATGTVDISIVEEFEDVEDWNPGDTTVKEVSVKNNGSLDAFVRVKLTPVWTPAEGSEAVLGIDNVALNLSDDPNWVKEGDYYYYLVALAPGAETPLLLESVTLIGAGTSNDYQGAELEITVDAQAIQVANVLDGEITVAKLAALDW
ncbi:MAG: hypothetical protein GX883_10650 [Firmicutes bacterium]|nr:hypothetical protein [Bacillota bacterium]